jgi:extracellular elastinolytic metalloproteinase
VTGNPVTGIRDYAMNWPMSGPFPSPGVDPQVNSLNLGDYEVDLTGQEVHADGEIWMATNYTLRQLLLNRYPSPGAAVDVQCANGQLPVAQCPGDRRWMQLYFDAMLLMPTEPTLIDARNAIVAADATRFGGANQDILWRGFAERGFGQFASAAATNDGNPIADFSSPKETNATVTFRAITQDVPGHETLVDARVYVGEYEARITQIADTNAANDPAAGPTNLDAVASFVPTAVLAGRRRHRSRVQLRRGRPRLWSRALPDPGPESRREADGHDLLRAQRRLVGERRDGERGRDGAVESDRRNRGDAVDQHGHDRRRRPAGARHAERPAVVPRDQGERAARARAEPVHRAALVRDPRLRRDNGELVQPGDRVGLDVGARVAAEPFPSVNPRPVAPDLIMRAWKIPKVNTTHVLFRVRTKQCSGHTSYQGEQDNGPQFSTDCRVTSLTSTGTVALPRRDTDVRAAEVELLSAPPRVQGAAVEDLGGEGRLSANAGRPAARRASPRFR